MFKKLLLITLLIAFSTISTNAENITISPVKKITTATSKLQEGDTVEFRDINNKAIITGIITSYEPNGFMGQNATLLIENFKIKNTGEKLSGLIYCVGNNHSQVMEFNLMPGFSQTIVRGGEVTINTDEKFSLDETVTSVNEKIPVKLIPIQIITTDYDEIEVGSRLRFKIANDIYKNDKLFIKKDTPVSATVSHFKENGWCDDSSEMELDNFITKDISNKTVKINDTLKINAFEMLKWQNPKIRRGWNYLSSWFRGKEFNIIPPKDNPTFNIWLK